MANGIVDVFPHKPFSVLLINFFPCPVHRSKSTFVELAIEAPKRIFTVHALKPRSLQSKEKRWTAEIFDGSDEDGFHQFEAEAEQWRLDVHTGSWKESVRKNIVSLLSDFASMWNKSLGKTTTAKHRINLQPHFRSAF